MPSASAPLEPDSPRNPRDGDEPSRGLPLSKVSCCGCANLWRRLHATGNFRTCKRCSRRAALGSRESDRRSSPITSRAARISDAPPPRSLRVSDGTPGSLAERTVRVRRSHQKQTRRGAFATPARESSCTVGRWESHPCRRGVQTWSRTPQRYARSNIEVERTRAKDPGRWLVHSNTRRNQSLPRGPSGFPQQHPCARSMPDGPDSDAVSGKSLSIPTSGER